MSARRRSTSSSSPAGSKAETLEEAWCAHCKYSIAGSRRAVWKYVGWPGTMPEKLRDFAVGGRYYEVDPPPRPMSGPEFEKWRSSWEEERQSAAAWRAMRAPAWEEGAGSSSAMAGTAATAEEGEDPLFLEALVLSKKEAGEKARAEEEEEAQAIAQVEALQKKEAAFAGAGVIVIDD